MTEHHTSRSTACVSATRRSAPVIDGLSARIPTGRITAVIGANACGKSTLLRGNGQAARAE